MAVTVERTSIIYYFIYLAVWASEIDPYLACLCNQFIGSRMVCRFILDNLVGPVAEVEEEGASAGRVKRSAASTILEDGIMEVDGNPRDGRPRREKDIYERYELEQSVQDLSKGRRCPTSHAPLSPTTPCPFFLTPLHADTCHAA